MTKDAPKKVEFYECAKGANEQILNGNTIHQKFWCSGCGEAQHMEKANAFYTQGKCEECGHITDIIKDGCNYLLIIKGTNSTIDYIDKLLNS